MGLVSVALRPLRHRDFRLLFVSLALMPDSMAIAGPAGAAFGVSAVFFMAGLVPVLLAVAAILVPRLHRDELAHPLDHPSKKPPATRPTTPKPDR